MNIINYITDFALYCSANRAEIFTRAVEHLEMTLLAVCTAILIGVPLGILISYVSKLNKPVLGLANVVQAIPSLALLGFLIPILGIGTKPTIFMVVIYSLLPVIKNTSTGLNNISKDTIESATGIGMTPLQVLLKVKLPLALPVIMAGVRISAVTAVGLVTIAAFIGAGGLGYLVYSGIRTVTNMQILAGAIPACIMALAIDFIASIIEKSVTPVSFRSDIQTFDSAKVQKVRKQRKYSLSIIGVVLAAIFVFMGISSIKPAGRMISIGTKDFTEQVILGNMYAELVEDRTDITVDRQFALGGTQVVFEAVRAGEVDMYVEYTGTVYGNMLNETDILSPDETYDVVKKALQEEYNMDMLDPLGFNNTWVIAVSQDLANTYNLKTVSDLTQVSNQLVIGATLEFLNRADGLPGLKDAYRMSFKEEIGLDGSPRYPALVADQTQITDAYATDGILVAFDLVTLEDDKNYFPPYFAAPLIQKDLFVEYPELEEIFNLLAGDISDADMRELNYKVDVEKLEPRDVAIDFLVERGLLQ